MANTGTGLYRGYTTKYRDNMQPVVQVLVDAFLAAREMGSDPIDRPDREN